jgi:UDPglucose 6-dehydrogenase
MTTRREQHGGRSAHGHTTRRNTVRIGVIGRGHVGQNVVEQFGGSNEVVSYDLKDATPYPRDELASCAFVMICVDTPARPDGSVDVSRVESAVDAVPNPNILIRSTVPPGTTESLAVRKSANVCFWPEYVGETDFIGSSWAKFAASEPFAIIGGTPDARHVFIDLLVPLLGPEVRIYQCAAAEAELAKYMENSYLAAKVTFVNEFRDLSDKLGLDWNTVREGWLLDPRIERDHTAVFTDQRGYSGKCLPKDVAGILKFAENEGVDLTMLSAVQEANRGFLARNGADFTGADGTRPSRT